jgi:hypothetical protein
VSAAAVVPATPFVTALRTERGKVVRIGKGAERLTLRVQFEPLWDAIAVDVPTTMPIADLTMAVLGHFGVSQAPFSDFIVKFQGWEVKGGDATVGSSGAKNGSTLLVQYRFRRPVR